MVFARWHAKMRRPAGDGQTERAHLEALRKRGSAKARLLLAPPPLPPVLAHVWTWFGELDAARGEGMSGPEPLTYSEIAAWASLTGRAPQPHEVALLLVVDGVTRHPEVEG